MNKKNVFKRVTAFVLAAGMAISLAVTGGGGNIRQVEAASVPAKQDSVSAINYKQVLGGGVDYGIIANSITQYSHMETTFATNTFTNTSKANNDVDYIQSTALFLIQNLSPGSKIYWGKSTASAMYLEAPADVFGDDFDPNYDMITKPNSSVNGNIEFGGSYGYAPVIQNVNPDAKSNVERLIKRINNPQTPEDADQAWSYYLSERARNPEYVLNPSGDNCEYFSWVGDPAGDGKAGSFTISIDNDDFKGKVVYINLTSRMLNALKRNGAFNIEKDPSTVVVFDIEESAVTDDVLCTDGSHANPYLRLDKPKVISNGSTYVGTTDINGNNDSYGWDDNSDDVNAEAVQKVYNETVIWNVMTEKDVLLSSMGGAMLLPKTSYVDISEGNVSGWIVTGADLDVHCEFHFLYSGSSRDQKGQIHFAVNKAFTRQYNTIGHVEQDASVEIQEGDYEFFWQEYEDDSYADNKKKGSSTSVEVDGDGAVLFPMLSFTYTDSSSNYYIEKPDTEYTEKDYYFMITENPEKTVAGVTNSDGNIKIKLTVRLDTDGNFTFFVDYDSITGEDIVYASYDGIKMSGVQFDLGRFYNKSLETGTLELTKSVLGIDDENSYKDIEYKVAVKTTINGQTYYVADERGTLSTTKTYLTIKAGEDNKLKIKNLLLGSYEIEEDEDSAQITGYTLKPVAYEPATRTLENDKEVKSAKIINEYEDNGLITTGELSLSKKVTGYNGSDDEYTIYVKEKKSGKYLTSLSTGELGEKTPFTIKAGQTLTFRNVLINTATHTVFGYSNDPTYDYVIEEDTDSAQKSGYDLKTVVKQGDTEKRDAVISFNPTWNGTAWINKTASGTIENNYNVHKSSLKINKVVSGLDSYTGTAPEKYYVTVQNKTTSEYVQNDRGELDTSETLLEVPANGTLEIKELPVGEYVVTEDIASAKINGYALTITGDGEVTVPDSKPPVAGEMTITNAYQEAKNSFGVSAKKAFKDLAGKDVALASGDFCFQLVSQNPYIEKQAYNDANGNIVFDDITIPDYVRSTTMSFTLRELSYNGNKANRQDIAYDTNEYTVTVTVDADGNITNVEHLDDVTFTNVEQTGTTPLGNLVIKKTFNGAALADLNDVKFTIDPAIDGVSELTLNKNSYATDGWSVSSENGNEVYTYTFKDLPVDASKVYTVTESATEDGSNTSYTCTTTTKTASGSIINESGRMLTINNTYESNTGDLQIKKTIKGDVTDEDLSGLKFTIYDSEDNKIEEVMLSQFTKKNAQSTDVKDDYTYTLTGLDASKTYYVVETLTTLAGFDVTVKYAVGNDALAEGKQTGNFSITAGSTQNVAYENEYTKQNTTGDLQIKKTIKGDVTDEDLSGLKFTIYDSEDNKIEEVMLSQFTKKNAQSTDVKDDYTYTLTGLDASKTYYVVETLTTLAGFDVTVKYAVGNDALAEGKQTGNFSITAGSTQNVAYENEYTKQNTTGDLQIKKTIKGDVTDEDLSGLKFTIYDSEDNKIEEVMLSQFTKKNAQSTDVKDDYTYTLTGLDASKTYYVVETLTTLAGFDVTVKYAVGNDALADGKQTGNFSITAGSTQNVAYENEYTKQNTTGDLQIKKTIKGDVTDEDLSGLKFTIYDSEDNKIEEVMLSQFTKKNAQSTDVKDDYTYTLTGLDASKTYYVVETLTTLAGFDVTVKYAVGNDALAEGKQTGNFSITAGSTQNVAYENEYTKQNTTGDLQIKKTIKGDVTDEDLSGLKFTIYDSEDNKIEEVMLSQFTKKNAQSTDVKDDYTYTLTGLDASKTYYVVETLTTLAGFDVTVKYAVGNDALAEGKQTGNFSITAGSTQNVAYENEYTKQSNTGDLQIKKTIKGDVTDEDLSGLKFTIYDSEDNKIEEVMLSQFTKKNAQSTDVKDDYTYTLTGLDASKTYYVVETLTTLAGFDVTVKYAVGNDALAEGKQTGNFSITAGSTQNVAYENEYKKQVGTLTLKKIVTSQSTNVPDETFTFEVTFTGDITGATASKGTFNGQVLTVELKKDNPDNTVTISGLPHQTGYTIVEKNLPANFNKITTQGLSGTIDASSDNTKDKTVEVTNEYTEPIPEKGSLVIQKAKAQGSDPFNGQTFDFSIKLTDSNDAPVAGITVNGGTYDDTTGIVTATLGEGDTVSITDIPDSTKYTVTEENLPAGYTKVTDDADMTGVIDATSVTSKDIQLVVENSRTIPTITISKKEVTNGPEIPGAKLVVTKDTADGTKVDEWISTDTPHELKLEAGTYVLTETVLPDEYHVQAESVTFTVDENGNVKKDGVDQGTSLVMIDDLGGILRITVQEEGTDRLVPDAEVKVTTVKPDGTKETKTYTTDSEGKIRITNLPPSNEYSYEVTKVPDGYNITTVGSKTAVEVKAGEETKELEKIKPKEVTPEDKTGTLIIIVLDEETKQPVPNATVTVKNPDGTSKTYTTDSNGKITLTKLPAGDYKITVTKVPDGYTVTTGKEETATVEVGKTTEHTALIGTKTTPGTPDTPSTPNTTPSTTPSSTPNQTTTTTTPSPNAPGTPAKSTSTVNTGDRVFVIPVVILMVLSLIALVVIIIRKRRMKYEN